MSLDSTSQEKKLLDEALYINRTVFGDDIDETVYENKHYKNPYRLSESFSITYEGEEAAGVAAFLGMRVILEGEEFPVYQCVDVSVLEKHQGRGHFSKALGSFTGLETDGRFLFGIPNDNSFPIFLKTGYTKALWLCHYLYITAPFSFVMGNNGFAKALDKFYQLFLWQKAGNAGEGEVLTIHEGMEDIPVTDEEIAALNSTSKCHFLHDHKTYKWKQSYNPDAQFHWAVLRKKDGTLLGYALCHLRPRMKGNFVIIDDYDAVGTGSEKREILKKLFSRLNSLGNLTEVPFVNVSKDGELLKSLHFANACKFPYKLRGGPMVLSPNCDCVELIKTCSFRNIDSDVI